MGMTLIERLLPLLALFAFLSTAFSAPQPPPAPVTTITLKESVIVAKNMLTLGDIATVTGSNSDTLAALSFGSSPLSGTATPWTREAVAQVVGTRFALEKIGWAGALVCRVSRNGRLLQAEEVESKLEAELTKLTNSQGEVQVREINNWSDIVVPEGAIDFSFEFSASTLRSAWAGANMRLTSNGEPALARALRFRWSWKRPAWQARNNVAADQPIDVKDFEAVTVDVLAQPIPVFIGEELPSDVSLTHGCVAGRLLTITDIKPQTLIKRGSPVVLRYQHGGLSIQVQVLALQDGARGQIIAVQNTSTRKKIMGRVTDEMTLDYVQ